jgi:hypothetical protein
MTHAGDFQDGHSSEYGALVAARKGVTVSIRPIFAIRAWLTWPNSLFTIAWRCDT